LRTKQFGPRALAVLQRAPGKTTAAGLALLVPASAINYGSPALLRQGKTVRR